MAQNVRWRHALYMQVERSSNTEWQTGEYNVGIYLLVWNNMRKLVLIPDKPSQGKFYTPKDEPTLDQLVGKVKAYQGNDQQLFLEEDQPHWD